MISADIKTGLKLNKIRCRKICIKNNFSYLCPRFTAVVAASFLMVNVVQLVRTSDCGSESRGFESHLSP